MTYAERDSIRGVIEGFLATGVVDEVLVVDNNAEPGTEEEVRKTSARIVHEPRQGYGAATRRGLVEATGDLIVLAEPDGTFLPEDITKLLVYSNECDVVFGTRTTRDLIWADANMDWLLRWGNWAVAKMVEGLFNTSHLSDVGCTYRVLRRDTAKHVANADEGRREPRGCGDHAVDDRLRGPLRGGARELPAAGGRLVGHGEPRRGHQGGAPDDRAGPAFPTEDVGPGEARSRLRAPIPPRAEDHELPFRRDRVRVRRVAPRARGGALPAQAHRLHRGQLPARRGARRGLRHGGPCREAGRRGLRDVRGRSLCGNARHPARQFARHPGGGGLGHRPAVRATTASTSCTAWP